ncbi:MAG: hypothetical protein ACKO0M_19235 [Cyanobium sp.]
MALRRHRLPRFWLALTLGPVVVLVALVYWWERQLPARIQQAASSGRLEDCLRYGEQLAALSWLPGGVPLEQGHCRRARALQLWQADRWGEALRLQRQLVLSPEAGPEDRRRLNQWQESLHDGAIARFRGGDLPGALKRLEPIGEAAGGGGLGDTFRQIWDRNRLLLERAERLSRQSRWWEALDALNRIDHPWWRQRSAGVRARVQKGVESLRGQDREHDSHGAVPHGVDSARLDALVRRRIAAGMDEWKAFDQSCRELGGKVKEEGPDTACER